jgi:hypothetical protein
VLGSDPLADIGAALRDVHAVYLDGTLVHSGNEIEAAVVA